MNIPDYLRPPEVTSKKIWGTLEKNDGKWIVDGHPYMISLAKRLFPGSRGSGHGSANFPASKRIVGDLSWFMMRFPLDVKDNDAWLKDLTEAQEHFQVQESMLKKPKKIMPSPKFIGELKEFQKEGLAFLLHNPRSLLADEMGLGKANWIESFVFTPCGRKKIKDIKVGDSVIGSDGKATIVNGVYPQGIRKLYRITFNDGSSTLVDKEHLWKVKLNTYTNCKYRTMSLKDIMSYGITRLRKKNGKEYNQYIFSIPMVSPIQFVHRYFKIHPYILGVVLGDGCIGLSGGSIELADKHENQANRCNKFIFENYCFRRVGNDSCKWRLVNSSSKINEYITLFKKLKLWKVSHESKFVPEEYLYASVEQRIDLLRGLFDTDASVHTKYNRILFSTTSISLAENVKFLVNSLGGTATIHKYHRIKYNKKPEYNVYVSLPRNIIPFYNKEKNAKYFSNRKLSHPKRSIKDIRYEKDDEAICIKVDAEDGLFVVDHCIVTHNTPTAIAWLTSLKCSPPYLIVVPPHILIQWKSEIKKFLGEETSVHIIKGLKPYSLPASEIYLIHYLLLRGWKNYLPRFGFKACVFDEIQELRHATSDKYSAASLLSDSVEYLIGLSGTFFYNYGSEAFNVINILDFHCLGDFDSFSREWCTGYGNKLIKDPKLLGEYLREEGLFLRRKMEDVLSELPPKRRVIQNIDVDEGKYDELIAPIIDQAKRISDIKDAFQRGRETMMAIDSTRMITGIAKAHYVCAFVKTLMEAGETVILYGHHHAVMDIYMDELKDSYPVMISGRQNATVKDEAQKAFMNGDTDLIIISLRSATGLNLQRARCVVFGELDWSPAILSQGEGRAHRYGVKDSVLCYYLTCNAGTDQAMLETLGLKTSQFVSIMGDKEETEHDRLMAQVDTKKHMRQVIELLQKGGRKKEISDEKTIEKLRKLEKLPSSKEPTSLSDFYDRQE